MNYFDIENTFLTIAKNCADTKKLVNEMNKYITREDCRRMFVDISRLNMMDAVKISTICSVKHFSKYPAGEIRWIVKDNETRSMLKPLELKTVTTSVKRAIIEA